MPPLLRIVPEPEVKLLRYVLAFLHEVSCRCDVNKMQGSNLAIVMAPNLLRQQEDSSDALEILGNSGKAGQVTEHMITQYPTLFPQHPFQPYL